MRQSWTLLLFVASSSLVCSGPHGSPKDPSASERPNESLLTRTAKPGEGPLAFPPDPRGRHNRPAMPSDLRTVQTDQAPRVVEPTLDDKGQFDVMGDRFRFVFNHAMQRPERKPAAGKAPDSSPIEAPSGTVAITPAVAGKARWLDAHNLEFVADKPLRPGQSYQVELAESLKTAGGGALEKPFKATFVARASVGGKMLSYVPMIGEHRVVVARPSGGTTVGKAPKMRVLFDQPISLGLANALVRLEDAKGNKVPLLVDHPKGPTFEGIKMDPRFVVLATPAKPLAPGETYKLIASDRFRSAERKPHESELTVAGPLELAAIDCGWGDRDECSVKDNRVETSGGEVHVRFNHHLATSGRRLEQSVSVVPRPKNLTIRSYGWDDDSRIILSGAFEPSRGYQVHVSNLVDDFGGRLAQPVSFAIHTKPVGASATMAEGILMLDESSSRRFQIHSRNVAEAELSLWEVATGEAAAFEDAVKKVRAHETPMSAATKTVVVPVSAQQDRFVDTPVDLIDKVGAGKTWLATLAIKKPAFGAEPIAFGKGSEASKPPVSLIHPGSKEALAVHAQVLQNATLVHVARLATGSPVAAASVATDSISAVTTDANGLAFLPAAASGVLTVKSGAEELRLAIGDGGATAKDLFPALAVGADAPVSDLRALVITDRGIYRPGAKVLAKANLRKPEGDKLVAARDAKARVRLVGPTGEEVANESASAGETGSIAVSFALPADAKLGRHQLLVEDPTDPEPPLARAVVQVAEFETPRFAVDVEAKSLAGARVRAQVKARYLFGAAMDGGQLAWTVKREAAPLPASPLADAGLSFRKVESEWFDEKKDEAWTRSGEARLGPDGSFQLEQAFSMQGSVGPQQVVIEADVSDSSNRHVAGRGSVIVHPQPRYAGLKVKPRWVQTGESVPVELGAMDTEGRPVVGATVTARLVSVDWTYARRVGSSGAIRYEWTARRTNAGQCSVKSATTPESCNLPIVASGDYEIVAEIDGRRGGSAPIWAWRYGDKTVKQRPSRGRTVEIVTDKARYAPGDTAKLLVLNPYPAATAIMTLEQGALVSHSAKRIESGAAMFEVPLAHAHAPHLHATVTLLPIGATGSAAMEYRIGAVRLPVSFEGARLEVAAKSTRATYQPGEEAELAVEVKDGGQAQAGAEVAVAVVDEGVLRLTNFHPVDPVQALRPGRALDFSVRDSKAGLADLLERSHVAGDGGGEGESLTSTRKNFVETAHWSPAVRTDQSGRAVVRFKLPDNLTQFRVMAVALDDEGKGGTVESDFTVKKPVMIIPVVPRFASVGDRLEVAAMVHNNTEQPFQGTVSLGDRSLDVTVAAGGHQRVGFPFSAETLGENKLTFAVRDSAGAPRDSVEVKIPVDVPGYDEAPQVEGAFAKHQDVSLEIPEDVRSRSDDALSIQVGEHLWPELGARIGYLMDYPHGCVEQTTSSTLPLVAGRDILPRVGATRFGDEDLRRKIHAGLERLASMRTPSGGLGYWPGDPQPNVYGTAYAIRAVILAKRTGLEPPRGLLEGMQSYLADHLLGSSIEPEVQAAIAQSLAELKELPASAADPLWDRREQQSVFGLASLAMALSTLPAQRDRVDQLLDEVEKSFDDAGKLTKPARPNDFHYFGSDTRSKAQAAMALERLRRKSKVLPRLVNDLAEDIGSYTTQATAYSLLALAQQLVGDVAPGADVRVLLDGAPLTASRDLGFGAKEFAVPLSALRGKKASLRLEGAGERAMGFRVSARWRRPAPMGAAGGASLASTSAERGPDIYRVYTDAKGAPVDLAHVKAGDVLRVALLVKMPSRDRFDEARLGYLAVTDRLPAGFEPIQPDLATVASVPELSEAHPLASLLRYGEGSASHVELHDDRVNLYFDRIWGSYVAASYLVRASTPGTFVAAPSMAELMYEGDSAGYGDAARVVVE